MKIGVILKNYVISIQISSQGVQKILDIPHY